MLSILWFIATSSLRINRTDLQEKHSAFDRLVKALVVRSRHFEVLWMMLYASLMTAKMPGGVAARSQRDWGSLGNLPQIQGRRIF